MSRWRRAFDRIGGPDAVTWPAFWITFVASILGNLTSGGGDSSLVTRLVILLVAQVTMFIPLVILRVTVLRDPPRPRPWVALGGFVLAAVIRGSVVDWLFLSTGVTDTALWGYRVFSSLLVQGSIFVVIAIVVGTMRAQTRALEELAIVQQELDHTQERIVAEVSGRNDDALDRVKARLADELALLDRAEGAASVAELQRLASDVVRPMSHELAAALPAVEVTDASSAVHVGWRQVVEQMSGSTALRPILNAIVMAFVLITATIGVLGRQGLVITAVLVVAVTLSSWLANLALRAVLPRVPALFGMGLVILAGLVVGFISGTAAAAALTDESLVWAFRIAGGLFIAGVVLLIALVSSVLRQQAASQRDLTESTERLRWTVVRLRQVQWFQGKALSRALHGPVQAAVTSAALRLDEAVREGRPTDHLLAEIRADLRGTIDVLEAGEPSGSSLDEALARIVGTWQGICRVDVDVEESAHARLAEEAVATSTVVDLLTEAVSNAVRHGEATSVAVAVTAPSPELVELRVRDDGQAVPAVSGSGLGTRLLDECTLEWSRESGPGGNGLRALLPA